MIAIYNIIVGISALILSSYSMVKNSERKVEERLYSTEVLLTLIIGSVLYSIIQLILIYGLKRNRANHLLFWLIIQIICYLVR